MRKPSLPGDDAASHDAGVKLAHITALRAAPGAGENDALVWLKVTMPTIRVPVKVARPRLPEAWIG